MDRRRTARELVRIAKFLVASDVMIVEAIMNTILGSKQDAKKLAKLTSNFRADLPHGEEGAEGRLAFWDETFTGVSQALRLKTDLPKIIGKRLVDMWAADISDIIIHDRPVKPRMQQKTAELLMKSGVDTAQLGRDMVMALLKELRGSFELVKFASEKVASQSNPDNNDIFSSTERIMFSIKTLQNASRQLGMTRESRELQAASRIVSKVALKLDKEWRNQNG